MNRMASLPLISPQRADRPALLTSHPSFMP